MFEINDTEIISELAAILPRFKKIGSTNYRFRCPLCGDSDKKESLCRGNIYLNQDKGNYGFKCFNCGTNHSLYDFAKIVDPNIIDKLRRFTPIKQAKQEIKLPRISFFIDRIRNNFETIEELPEDHEMKQYLIGRKIPSHLYSDLFYAKSIVDVMKKFPNVVKDFRDQPAIVIPFYDEHSEYDYIQFRLFGEASFRYLTVKVSNNENTTKCWGMKYINPNNTVYVIEGTFDAMMVKNGISSGGHTSMISVADVLTTDKDKTILVFDKDYETNKDVLKQLNRSIKKGYKNVIYDNGFQGKDLNDVIKDNHMNQMQLQNYLYTHTCDPMQAMMKVGRLRP